MTMRQPAFFLSHGAPDLALGDSPARRFLERLGPSLERPRAILVASAPDEADGVVVRAPARFETWHDFGNFDRRLFDVRYEPVGAGDVAVEAMRLLGAAGLAPRTSSDVRLDHGAWVPLSLMFPVADVPLASVSINPRDDAAWHEAVGRALAPLRDGGVLVVGSGSISHNLHEVFAGSRDDRTWVEAFTAWLEARVATRDRGALLAAMRDAPAALRNHPTDEHLLPFYVALGAGGGEPGRRLHHSYTYDVLAMDVYAWGDAAALARLPSDDEMIEHAG